MYMYYYARSRRGDVLAAMARVVYTRCKRTLGFDTRPDRRGVHSGVTSVDGTQTSAWMVAPSVWHGARCALRSPDSRAGTFSFSSEIAGLIERAMSARWDDIQFCPISKMMRKCEKSSKSLFNLNPTDMHGPWATPCIPPRRNRAPVRPF